MAKQSEQQMRVNLQFNEDLAGVKTEQLFFSQALGAVVETIEALLARLVQRRVLAADDALIHEFSKAIATVRTQGLRLQAPVDPDAPSFQVRCPGCDAVIKAPAGQRVERCDWCGHVFEG